MSKPLLIEPKSGGTYYWSDIAELLQIDPTFFPYKQPQSALDVLLQLVKALIRDEAVVLPDADFSPAELAAAGISRQLLASCSGKQVNIPNSYEDFTSTLKNLENWSVTLFTSGTTGQPKKVTHNFLSITRGIKQNTEYTDHIWAWAYNPTHMAGIQVFFQALLNGNPLVSVFDLPREQILDALGKSSVTHISATPTFYRMLFPIERSFPYIRNITFGGERMDEHLSKQLKKAFPKARLRNVYASTEAGSLFAAEGPYFRVSDKLSNRVRIKDNELYLHRSLLGQSDDLNANDSWYKTGDLVEFSDENKKHFRFLSRRNEMINVGGYKVNPNEVEEAINACPGVIRSLVYGKKNPVLGQVVMAEVIPIDKDLKEKDIRAFLANKLQAFKIPRMIKFVKEIAQTRSGKNIRR